MTNFVNRSPIYIVFLKAVQEKNWSQTEKICQIFNLRHTDCLEFAGDIFLKKGKVYLALNIYNVARVPPMKTALKLAMFGQNNALMQLCSIALQNTYMLGQNYPLDMNLKTIIKTNGYNHLATEDLLETVSVIWECSYLMALRLTENILHPLLAAQYS